MLSCRFGGSSGYRLELQDTDDLVVVRSTRRGARHDVSPLSASTRRAQEQLSPLFGFPSAGVGVYSAPLGHATELAETINADPEVEFAGRGLRDQFGAPVVYTENIFVKFRDDVSACDRPYGDSPPSNIASFPFQPNGNDLRKIRGQLKPV